MTDDDTLQLYLRAEPSDAGRDLLLEHRRRMEDLLASLTITPRLVADHDLHRTELFLGSVRVWRRAFRAVDAHPHISMEDLQELVNLPEAQRRILPGIPWRYEPFFPGRTSAVFVLRLRDDRRSLQRALLTRVASVLRTWERDGTLPPGTAKRLLSHRAYPLTREQKAKNLHVTLGRGRVRPDRHRDVARSLHGATLAAEHAIPFARIDVRAARSGQRIAPYAPLSSLRYHHRAP